MAVDKELMERAKELLSEKESINSKLSVAKAKIAELEEELAELEPEVEKAFGTTDIDALQEKLQELVAEADELIEQIQ